MGSELVSTHFPEKEGSTEQTEGSTALLSYKDIFNQCLPYYLSIGMTYDQFWHDDVELVKYYRRAHEMKQDRKNQELWLQGRYVYDALCSAAPLYRFTMKGGKIEALPYTKEPYPRTEKQAREMQKREEKAQMEKMKADLEAKVASINKAFAEKQKEKEVVNDAE